MSSNDSTKKIAEVLSAILCGPRESPFRRIAEAAMLCFALDSAVIFDKAGKVVCSVGDYGNSGWKSLLPIGDRYVMTVWAKTQPHGWCQEFVDDFPKYVSGMVDGLSHSIDSSVKNTFYLVVKEGLCLCSQDGVILQANPAMRRMFARVVGKCVGKRLDSIVHPEDSERVRAMMDSIVVGEELEFDCRITDGENIAWLSWSMVLFTKKGVSEIYASARDVTDRKKMESYVTHIAHHDSLTSLPNRNFLEDELHNRIFRAKRSKGQVAVMFVDLDKFKQVNDTFGHRVGDLLLCEVANRLKVVVRGEDHVARHGGDEFIVVADGDWSQARAEEYASRIRLALEEPFSILGETCEIGASIGIAIYPNDGSTPEELICKSDKCMYEDKHG